jgi:hypothetical protein
VAKAQSGPERTGLRLNPVVTDFPDSRGEVNGMEKIEIRKLDKVETTGASSTNGS